MTGYTPQNVVEPDPERLHTCRHPVTSVTHRCSCPIQADHSDAEWRDRLPKETRA